MHTEPAQNFSGKLMLAAGLLLLSLALAGWWPSRPLAGQAGYPQPVALTPTLTGQTEYCLTCHADLPEISSSHPVKTFGCVSCHGGQRLALDADAAHSTMRGGKNPSDLAVVEQGCGGETCHGGTSTNQRDHIQRVLTSLQSTYAGAISSVRFTFGAQANLTPLFGAAAVSDFHTQTGISTLAAFDPSHETNPLIQKFGQNCLTCHLHSTPREGTDYTRFTGCASCHTPLHPAQKSPSGQVHRLTTAIPFTQCNTCHNRGNYDLRQMTFTERTDQPVTRLQSYYQPIGEFTQCEYTLDCVDCHTRNEVMGDGDIHASINPTNPSKDPNSTRSSKIQYVQCKTCHGTPTELPLTRTLTDPNDLAFRQAFLNPVLKLQIGNTILVSARGEPLWNTRVRSDGTYEMIGKATSQYFIFKPVMGSGCTQNGQDQSSAYCHQCHAIGK